MGLLSQQKKERFAFSPQGFGGVPMALYFMDVRNISKGKQSAIAKAAYVSGCKLYSERDEEYKKFRKREEQPVSFILAPSHAPEWVYDRERLWNEAEKVEKPINARVQREVLIALPIELTKEQNIELVREYVEENFVSEGMVADVNIHFDKKENPHAHILLTVRPFNEDGTWWKTKSKKEYLKDENGNFILDKNGNKKSRKIDLTGWNSKEKLIEWRENLAEKINQKYKEYGIDQEVTHLSYEEAGIEKIAKHRLSRNEYYIEEKEKKRAFENGEEYIPVTTYGKLNSEIEKYNLEILKLNNEIQELENELYNTVIEDNKIIGIRDYILQKQNELNKTLNTQESNAIKFVLSRSKTDVFNYEAIQKAEASINGWGLRISRKVRELNTEKELLNTIKNLSKENPEKLIDYGFNKENFTDLFNQYISNCNKLEISLAKEFEKYREALNEIKIAKDIQYKHLKILFDTVYPKHKEITKYKTDENMKVMDKYLNEFIKENVIKPVFEFEAYSELSNKDEHVFRTKTIRAIEEYKRFAPQYFGLNKRIDLLEKQLDKIENIPYEKRLELKVMKEELKYVQQHLENTKHEMYNSLIELYGEESKSIISKIPDKIKLSILQDFIDKREVKELNEHLQNAKDKWDRKHQNEHFVPRNKAKDNTEENVLNVDRNVGDLLSQLISQNISNQHKSKFDEENEKRRKKGYSKGYKTKDYERGY